jgi:hypothetical protein
MQFEPAISPWSEHCKQPSVVHSLIGGGGWRSFCFSLFTVLKEDWADCLDSLKQSRCCVYHDLPLPVYMTYPDKSAAVIAVTLWLVARLQDHVEWCLSRSAYGTEPADCYHLAQLGFSGLCT